jgi:hypothetical protein
MRIRLATLSPRELRSSHWLGCGDSVDPLGDLFGRPIGLDRLTELGEVRLDRPVALLDACSKLPSARSSTLLFLDSVERRPTA